MPTERPVGGVVLRKLSHAWPAKLLTRKAAQTSGGLIMLKKFFFVRGGRRAITVRHKLSHTRKYDYRYSQLNLVFGRLLREKWIDEEDLRGLGEDKLPAIRSYAKFFAGTDTA
jgi:hypothetical protein